MKARREGFTLVEILIVVVILGILAAIVIPQFTNASESAKASNLLSQLQTIRSQLELYQIQHNSVYPNVIDDGWDNLLTTTDQTGNTDGSDFGPYLQQPPVNPFNDSVAVAAEAADDVGWVWENNIMYAVIPSTVDAAKVGLDDNSNVRIVAGGEEEG